MASGSLGGAYGDLIAQLAQHGVLSPQQQATAQSLYHVTDVKHAASILVSGAILSRNAAQAAGLFVQETGNADIIGGQGSWIADRARLYFRPATPSLFHSEGIRPRGRYRSGECPVPVCLGFHARSVLDMPGVVFSNGNTIEHDRLRIGSSSEELGILDLADILSEGAMPDDRVAKDVVTFRRHAEVMVPERLPIDLLGFIAVRTPAERDTLFSLVQATAPPRLLIQRLERLVRVDRSPFCNYWARMERCWVEDGAVWFEIARGTCSPEPQDYRPAFDLHLSVETPGGRLVDSGWSSLGKRTTTIRWEIATLRVDEIASVGLYMDGQLAYQGTPVPSFSDESFD